MSSGNLATLEPSVEQEKTLNFRRVEAPDVLAVWPELKLTLQDQTERGRAMTETDWLSLQMQLGLGWSMLWLTANSDDAVIITTLRSGFISWLLVDVVFIQEEAEIDDKELILDFMSYIKEKWLDKIGATGVGILTSDLSVLKDNRFKLQQVLVGEMIDGRTD